MLRDPRFDDLSGEYKPEIFEKTYNFIGDIKQREKEVRLVMGRRLVQIWLVGPIMRVVLVFACRSSRSS